MTNQQEQRSHMAVPATVHEQKAVPGNEQTRQPISGAHRTLTQDEQEVIRQAMVAWETKEKIRQEMVAREAQKRIRQEKFAREFQEKMRQAMAFLETQEKILRHKKPKARAPSSAPKSESCSINPTGTPQGHKDTHQTIIAAEIHPAPVGAAVPCVAEVPQVPEAPRGAEVPLAAEAPAVSEVPFEAEVPPAAEVTRVAEVPSGAVVPEHVLQSGEDTGRPVTTGVELNELLDRRRGECGQLTTCVIN